MIVEWSRTVGSHGYGYGMANDENATSRDVALLVAATGKLGSQENWSWPGGYPNSLALCAIDSVYSLRARYAGVTNVVARYREHRKNHGSDSKHDGGPELLAAIVSVGGPERAASDLFDNHTKAPGTNVLKSVALAEAVSNLAELKLHTTADLRGRLQEPAKAGRALEQASEDYTAAYRAWTRVRGLGPASWHYLLMLAGIDGVKADTMVTRFVANAIGERKVSPKRASRAVRQAAEELCVRVVELDHTIWRYQSGRYRPES